MPRRKIVIANNEVYHIVNRSIAKIPIFKGKRDYQRALETIDFYRFTNSLLSFSHYKRLQRKKEEEFIENLRKNKTLIEIFAFCLMPNHCHFLLKQNQNKGISIFMGNFLNSYARYFNTKYKRSGALFQSMFKAIRIESDEQLLHISRYIHLNPSSAYLIEIKALEGYPWSSFPEYTSRIHSFTKTDFILNYFKTKGAYKKFVFDQAEYQRELQKIKHLILEE